MTPTTIRGISCALLLLLSICVAVRGWAAAPEFDLAIQGGRIFDGTGGPSYLGDVGIQGERIVYVGRQAMREGALGARPFVEHEQESVS